MERPLPSHPATPRGPGSGAGAQPRWARSNPLPPRPHPRTSGCGRRQRGRPGARRKGAFSPQCAAQIGNSSAEVIGSVGRSALERLPPVPPPHDQSRRSKLAQMLGDSVQIQLWFGSRSHAWLHVGPGLLDRIQPPGLRRALFPSAASPRSPHTCVPLGRLGQPGRIRHRQEPGAPAGSSHFISPAVPGARQPPAWPPPGPGPRRGAERTPPGMARLRPGNS